MDSYEAAIKEGMMPALDDVNERIFMLQSSTNHFAISDALRVIDNKAVLLLEGESKKGYRVCSGSGRANKVTRAHEETLGNIWCVLSQQDIPCKGYRDFFTRKAGEFKAKTEYPLRTLYMISRSPFWFKKLPVLTALSFFSFVIYIDLWHITASITQQEPGREEEAVYQSLEARKTEDYKEEINAFQELFRSFYVKQHNLIGAAWEKCLPDRSVDYVSPKIKQFVEDSLSFLKECDHIFRYRNFRNKPFMETIAAGWKHSVGGTSSSPKLGRPPRAECVYSVYSSTWSQMLDNLIFGQSDGRIHTLVANNLVCRELAMRQTSHPKTNLSSVGYSEDREQRLRDREFKVTLLIYGRRCIRLLLNLFKGFARRKDIV